MPRRSKLVYGSNEMLVTLVYLLQNNGTCLDNIRELHAEQLLLPA